MTLTSIRVNEKVNLIQTESQSVSLMKHLLFTSFSCIGYLRDLFEEKNFSDHFVCELALKRLSRGISVEADTFLDWVEIGIYDALDKKYLRCIYLGIFTNPDEPYNVLEWYTFKVTYAPFDRKSLNIDISSLSIEQNDKEILYFSQNETDFKRSTVQILRTMCILTQTLKSLPPIKYLTIRLSYYEDRTPYDYQPPLFQDCHDDLLSTLGASDLLKFDLGQSSTPFHSISLKIHSKSDQLPNDDRGSTNLKTTLQEQNSNLICTLSSQPKNEPTSSKLASGNFIAPLKITDFHDDPLSTPEKNNFKTPSNNPTLKDSHGANLVDCSPISKTTNEEPFLNTQPPLQEVSNRSAFLHCLCGSKSCNEAETALLQCDQCQNWHHTVCCGYYSNTDKRIRQDGQLFSCFNCKFKDQPKILKFCADLCLVRRALFISFNCLVIDNIFLAKSLSISCQKAASILRRLCSEGFIFKTPPIGLQKKSSFECIKNNDVKKKIKYYFSLDLDIFPEYQRALGKNPNTLQLPPAEEREKISNHHVAYKKRKQSSTIEMPLKCNVNF